MIYIVIGQTGEYSDRTEWPVRAFESEEAAQEFIDEVRQVAAECRAKAGDVFVPKCVMPEEPLNPLDPLMEIDVNGTSYSYWCVPTAEGETPRINGGSK